MESQVPQLVMLLQIKDVLHQRSPGALASDLGPLAEMEFWRRRNEDLQGLCRQISSPGTCLQICHSTGPLRGRFLRGMSKYHRIILLPHCHRSRDRLHFMLG